jgi:RNA polymerase sigma-70 factor (ECF subfamily)
MTAVSARNSSAANQLAEDTPRRAERDFGNLVREHQSMVFSIAYHFLQDRASAEEVGQEVFLELYRRVDELQTPEHLKNWLRKVAVNRCVDHSRRSRLRPRIGLDEVPEPPAPASEGDPLLAGRLRRLIAALPERWRTVVILRYQEDLEPAEIAAALRLPLGTVKSQLHRALGMLREKLTEPKGVIA